MRIAYLGPAGTFTEDALGEAAPGSRVRAAADGDDPRRDPRRRARRGGPRPGPVRELDRGLGPRHPRRARLRGRGGDDRRRARLRRARPPDRPRGGSSSSSVEAVLSHQQPLAQCARFLREELAGVELRSVSSTAAAVRMVGESVRPWAAIGVPRGGRALRLRDRCARGSRTRPTTSPASSGSRRPAPSRAARDPGRPRSSSPSSARTIRAPWSTPCASSPTARST